MSYHASEKIGTENRRKGATPETINTIAATTPLLHCRPPPLEDLQWCWKTIADLPPLQIFPQYNFNRYRFIFIYSFYFFVILWENTRHLDNWIW